MRKLGEILREFSGLPVEAVDRALGVQSEKGGRIGELLLQQGSIQEIELAKALSEQQGYDFLPSLPQEFDTSFTGQVSIQFLKKFKILPVSTGEQSFIAVNDPFLLQPVDDLRRLLGWPAAEIRVVPQVEIVSAINLAYDLSRDSAAEQVIQDMQEEDTDRIFSEISESGDLLDDTSDAPVIKLVNFMFAQAIRAGASDIHIEPYQKALKIRQRIDGVLYDMFSPPPHIHATLVSRIKIMAKLNIAEKRLPQDGRTEIRIADKSVDVRVSTLPTAFGERVVLRLLDKSTVLLSLTDLGMPKEKLASFDELIHGPHGILLVTGPTGSGKTTTLYAALSTINDTDINIITIEDPVEYQIAGIGQVQVNPKINLTFANGLRSIVRQDPDVILVGEIRDLETARIAIQSALTGHLVFSTLHTNDAASAVTRLIDMGIEPFLVTSSVNAILAQRLVRLLCRECRTPYEPEAEGLARIGLSPEVLAGGNLFRDRGCAACLHTGYSGREGIFELMVFDDALRTLILKTSDANAIKQLAVQHGMETLRRAGAAKVLAGTTTIEEVVRVTEQ